MADSPENTTQTMEIAQLDTQRLPLSEVTAHPDNPRIHTQEQIKAIQESYRLDGYIAGSMGIQISRKRLYKGHAVYEALDGIGVTHADFVVMDLTDEATLALLARDNALSDMSTNDFPKLKAIEVKLQKMDVPIERMGQTLESMKELESDWETLTGEFDVDETEFPTLATGDRQPFQQMTFTLADEQAEEVKAALAKAKEMCPFVDTGNENSNGNALARMAETYLGQS